MPPPPPGIGAAFGSGRSANTPTLTGGVAFLAEDEGRPAGVTQGAVAFGTAPGFGGSGPGLLRSTPPNDSHWWR